MVNEGMAIVAMKLLQRRDYTIEAVAEELEIKPYSAKSSPIAHKASLGQTNKEHEDLNEIGNCRENSLSYVDAILDRDSDRIFVVERLLKVNVT